MKKLFIIILGILFILPFASAITLDSTVVLETTISNSSMTFSIDVTVTEIIVEPTYIYLLGVSYVQDGVIETCTYINYSTENTNLDSADFPCGDEDEEIIHYGGSATFSPSSADLKEGYTKVLLKGWKVIISFDNKDYEVKVEEIFEDKIKLSVKSIVFELNINETKKVSLDGNNYYDLKIFVKSIDGIRTQLEFKEIHEEIPAEKQEEQEKESKVEKSKWWVWVIIILGIVFITGVGVYLIKKKKK